jgi:16S rRNA (uracil1498-N3)-methyltransferase
MFIVDAERLRGAERILLDGDEGRHAAVVRRLGRGETVELTDGHGSVARCVVVAADRSGLVCEVRERAEEPPPTPRIVVAQALPKGDRGEAAVETMTEVGVDEIVPWRAQRAVTRWQGDRGDRALRRWRSTAREAAKQARRAWVPEVADPVTTAALARRLSGAALAIVLHEEADRSIGDLPLPDLGELVLVVGPEGGITPDELAAFDSAGAVQVNLGPAVLRTSTAGTVAAGVMLSRTGRWRDGPSRHRSWSASRPGSSESRTSAEDPPHRTGRPR